MEMDDELDENRLVVHRTPGCLFRLADCAPRRRVVLPSGAVITIVCETCMKDTERDQANE